MKLSTPLFASLMLAAVGLAGCGDKNTADNATSTVPGTEMTEQGQAPVATEDNTAGTDKSIDFIQKAAQTDMFEIESSKLAATKAQTAAVKSYAAMLIKAHTETSASLKPLAAALSIEVPAQLDSDHAAKLDDLKKADAKDFDEKFIDVQTDVHENALNLLKDQADNGTDATLKAFASATAPKVQKHLDEARKLDKSDVDEPKKP